MDFRILGPLEVTGEPGTVMPAEGELGSVREAERTRALAGVTS